jgi:hypothetical protein
MPGNNPVESIYPEDAEFDEQPLIKKDTHSVYISKNHDNVGNMIHHFERRQSGRNKVRISRSK